MIELESMTGITYFVALPFDVADSSIIVGEPIDARIQPPR
jgi:hypothetical protein